MLDRSSFSPSIEYNHAGWLPSSVMAPATNFSTAFGKQDSITLIPRTKGTNLAVYSRGGVKVPCPKLPFVAIGIKSYAMRHIVWWVDQ